MTVVLAGPSLYRHMGGEEGELVQRSASQFAGTLSRQKPEVDQPRGDARRPTDRIPSGEHSDRRLLTVTHFADVAVIGKTARTD